MVLMCEVIDSVIIRNKIFPKINIIISNTDIANGIIIQNAIRFRFLNNFFKLFINFKIHTKDIKINIL